MIRVLRLLIYFTAMVLSYPASWLNRIGYSRHQPLRYVREHRTTRFCVLCRTPMARDFRPERDGRRQGKIIKIPEDLLAWWRCPPDDGCGQSQQGEVKT